MAAAALVEKQREQIRLIENFMKNTRKAGSEELIKKASFIERRMELLNSYWNKVVENHDLLIEHKAEASLDDYFKKAEFDSVECKYIEHVVTLTDMLEEARPPPTPTHNSTMLSNAQAPATVLDKHSLPKIAVPIFSGEQADWESWKERFTAIVKDAPSVPAVVKLQHLLNSVDGEAARKLKGTKITAANFELTWEKLTRRYDNKRIRLTKHIESLVDLASASRKSAGELNRILDTAQEAIQGFKDLALPVQHWDALLIFFVVRKLDNDTRENWEISLESETEMPTYTKLADFLERRIQSLEQATSTKASSGQSSGQSTTPQKNKSGNKAPAQTKNTLVTSKDSKPADVPADSPQKSGPTSKSTSSPKQKEIKCSYCADAHYISQCISFKTNFTVQQRRDFVKNNKMCFNCLSKAHSVKDCASKSTCYLCGQRHHTILHIEGNPAASGSTQSTTGVEEDLSSSRHVSATACNQNSDVVLMATATVILQADDGRSIPARALIDPASETTLISERVVNILELPRRRSNVSLFAVGAGRAAEACTAVTVQIKSRVSYEFNVECTAFVLNKITTDLPRKCIKQREWPHTKGLQLADPRFWRPAKIDCLLGADVYPLIILNDCRVGPANTPVAQLTRFGWTLTGMPDSSGGSASKARSVCHVTIQPSLSSLLSKFWEIEEVASKQLVSPADEDCENQYSNGVKRLENGMYSVKLPFSKQGHFTDSRNIAIACLLRSEKNHSNKPQFKEAYNDFMNEYLALGHMEEVPAAELHREPNYYLPHHAVLRADGKLRVVFNASQRSSNGISLNDCLHQGKKLQINITAIISNWRQHAIVFSSDIVKMFRQILIHKEDRDWQRIVWRKDSNAPIRDYRLRTVTYGTTSAPFLAIRTLHQLANDEQQNFPLAAHLLRHQTYVDDIFGGADNLEQARQLCKQLVDLMNTANISLSKWTANDVRVLQGLPTNGENEIAFKINDIVSTLGLNWSPSGDFFTFKVTPPPETSKLTKRIILSEISRLYDPLGWLAPFLIQAKILMQDLWIHHLDWDVQVPPELQDRWLQWRDQLTSLADIRIPRWYGSSTTTTWSLHAFSDASNRAYSAAVYYVLPNGTSTLIISKTKSAPVKTISIPKLELSGALLLVRLVVSCLDELENKPNSIYCWTDSSVVLDWLKDHPSRWKPFVANRVSEILTSLPQARWNHIRSAQNPADCATRGLTAAQLKDFHLWWQGPPWISNHPSEWPISDPPPYSSPSEERNSLVVLLGDDQARDILDILEKFSSLDTILKILIYCRRWHLIASHKIKNSDWISAAEWRKARLTLFKLVQQRHFAQELQALRSSNRFSKLNAVGRLAPFIDEEGLMRVGGRLNHAFIPYGEKHPIILPKDGFVTQLLIKEAHLITLHGGSREVESYLLRSVWIIHGRRQVQSAVRKCVRCVRMAQNFPQQQMAPLPAVRLRPANPFEYCGLDYAGPVMVKSSKGRGVKATKGYIAIFVCMVVKAVHIELVSDLTSASFIAAYHRMGNRRSYPAVIYSDNAKTFVGASTEIGQLFRAQSSTSTEISQELSRNGTSWSFIPPRAPHFGGLWEAAVKSFKHHYSRVVQNQSLTYEEFLTLNCKIEGCLNSRPLCPMSCEGNDLVPLTPGHFLVGKPILAPPEPHNDTDLAVSYRSRWHLVTAMTNHFWQRWRKEVLHNLQQRNKWLTPTESPKVGDVVIIKDELAPPTRWPLGRVTAVHPGKDGLNRVLTMKTEKNAQVKRALNKVILLPEDDGATAKFQLQSLSNGSCHGGRRPGTIDDHQDSAIN